MKEKDILLISDFTQPIGGVEIYNEILADSLREEGHNVEIFGGEKWGELSQHILSIVNINSTLQISKLKRRFDPDIVLVHKIYENVSPWFLALFRDTPVIFILPDFYQFRYSDSKDIKGKLLNIRTDISKALADRTVDSLVVPSAEAESHVENIFGPERVTVIPNPCPWEISEPKRLNKLNKEVLFVGRLEEEKGVELLLEEFKILKSKYEVDNVGLKIIGEGSFEDKIRECKSYMDQGDSINLIGNIPHHKVKNHYRFSDITVLPSLIKETFGLVLIESMSQATPIVTTDLGAQNELVVEGRNGYTFNPNNSGELAKKIFSMLSHTYKYERMSKNCTKIADCYTVDVFKKNYQILISNLLSSYAD